MPAILKNTKLRGEYAEVLFLERAMRQGYVVCQPYGDSAPFDFVVGGSARRLKRVQVKSAWSGNGQGVYAVPTGGYAHPMYTINEIDLLAAYVAAAEAWYIIPVEAFSPALSITVNPGDPANDEWGKYREQWWRLGRRSAARGMTRPKGESVRAAPEGARTSFSTLSRD